MGYRNAVHLAFAIPDHPWVDSASGADVRIAMTVGTGRDMRGTLQTVTREEKAEGLHRAVKFDEEHGKILSDLTIGADVAGAETLEANEDLSFMGAKLVGDFTVMQQGAEKLGLGEKEGIERHLPRFRNRRDLTQHVRASA